MHPGKPKGIQWSGVPGSHRREQRPHEETLRVKVAVVVAARLWNTSHVAPLTLQRLVLPPPRPMLEPMRLLGGASSRMLQPPTTQSQRCVGARIKRIGRGILHGGPGDGGQLRRLPILVVVIVSGAL